MSVVYIIKNKLDSGKALENEKIYNRAETSFTKNKYQYYNTNAEDGKILHEFKQQKDGKTLHKFKQQKDGKEIIMMVSYVEKGRMDIDGFPKNEIKNIYLGNAELQDDNKQNEKCNIKYWMKKQVICPAVIINMIDNLELDIGEDFEPDSYLLINEAEQFSNMVIDYMSEEIVARRKNDYNELDENYKLADYAQHNKHCVRMYGLIEESSRSEFQRDRERIVNCKSFRRLVDKAQIFSAKKAIIIGRE